MSVPITSVTENRVTVTANDTEANIRAAAGFAEAEKPAEPETPDVEAAEPDAEPATPTGDRNPDGTFKAKEKAEEVEKPAKADGDPRKSIQAKINVAVAKQREAERRAEEAERRANEREAELQALRQPRQPAPTAEPEKPAAPAYLDVVQQYQALPNAPKLDDFVNAGLEDPYSAYASAMAAFVADQRYAEREARDAATRAQREREAHTTKVFEIGEQNHPGLQAQIQADTRQYPNAVLNLLAQEAAQDPHLSAELLHHLLTHPDDADQLARRTDPIAAAREIGRLVASLSPASSGPETVLTQTTAKPLIKPVRPSVMAHESAPPDDLPFGPRYIAEMNERDRKAREARRA